MLNPYDVRFKSVSENEEKERWEKLLTLFSTVAMVLIFPVVVALHIMAVMVFLFY